MNLIAPERLSTQMVAVAVATLCFWAPACAYQVESPPETETITFEELDPGEGHLEPFDIEVPESEIRYRIDIAAASIYRIEGDAEPTLAWRPTFDGEGVVSDEAYEAYRAQLATDFRSPQLAEVSAEGFGATRLEVERRLSEGLDERALVPSGSAGLVPGEQGTIQPIWNPVGWLLGIDEMSGCQAAWTTFGLDIAIAVLVAAALVITYQQILAPLFSSLRTLLRAHIDQALRLGQIERAGSLQFLLFELRSAYNGLIAVLALIVTRFRAVVDTYTAAIGAARAESIEAWHNFSQALGRLHLMKTVMGGAVVAFVAASEKVQEVVGWVGELEPMEALGDLIDTVVEDVNRIGALCSDEGDGTTPGECGLPLATIRACEFADATDHVHVNSIQTACYNALLEHPDADEDDARLCVADCVRGSTARLTLHEGSTDYWECGDGHASFGDSSTAGAGEPAPY